MFLWGGTGTALSSIGFLAARRMCTDAGSTHPFVVRFYQSPNEVPRKYPVARRSRRKCLKYLKGEVLAENEGSLNANVPVSTKPGQLHASANRRV
jgi:hypothetical protein